MISKNFAWFSMRSAFWRIAILGSMHLRRLLWASAISVSIKQVHRSATPYSAIVDMLGKAHHIHSIGSAVEDRYIRLDNREISPYVWITPSEHQHRNFLSYSRGNPQRTGQPSPSRCSPTFRRHLSTGHVEELW